MVEIASLKQAVCGGLLLNGWDSGTSYRRRRNLQRKVDNLFDFFVTRIDVARNVSTTAVFRPCGDSNSKHPPPFRLATLKNLKIPTIPNLTTSRKSHARTGQTEPRPRQSPLFWRTSNSEFHYITKKPLKNRPNGIDLAF